MTESEKIQLVDAMIRENPEYTVKDFVDMVKEIVLVETSTQELSDIKFYHIAKNPKRKYA